MLENAGLSKDAYAKAISAISDAAKGDVRSSPGISVKLSALHPRYEYTHRDTVMEEQMNILKASQNDLLSDLFMETNNNSSDAADVGGSLRAPGRGPPGRYAKEIIGLF